MKIAVCSKNEGLKALVDERFGRADKFVIYDVETKDVKTIENSAKNEGVGAGGQAVKNLYDNNVEVAIVPQLGPKAVDAFKAFEIKVYSLGESKTVEEAIEKYKNGDLKELKMDEIKGKGGLRRA
ncbi:NifB/NifX family molybdenum-iron cluster-binding protein [Maledivibacter halophilus]|uniref:Predicted Fe-Mo cluster-binding protein, NifX family n=1 Tax=Maledivibacter halophilus TaxID=36842 RepID=A0A1T5LM35_9FIRM|nr:NifB/NifX family molybdenum-iron cluster-binding protein [Maledivibacter halophilus]SKC77021.1 Predicted Fe-Mo cluster-binding protein, NifX family [Maledivibacter halophilus]